MISFDDPTFLQDPYPAIGACGEKTPRTSPSDGASITASVHLSLVSR